VDAVTIAIEAYSSVFAYQWDSGIAIIRQDRRKGAKAFGTESFLRNLACFPVDAFIGNLFQPLPNLRVDIRKIHEGAQRPEVFPKVPHTVFNFAFFPACRLVAGFRVKPHLTGKCQEPGIESNNPAIMFRYGSSQVVVQTLSGSAAHELKGMNVAADKGLKTLAVSKLDIKSAAVAFNAAKGVEFALVPLIIDRAKMTPVDLKAIAGAGFDPHISAWGIPNLA
jgi:hypothetical protein